MSTSATSDQVFGGDGLDLVFGNQSEDTLDGGNDNDSLFGGQGNDSLAGNLGDDWLFGDGGNDTLFGGNGNDKFVFKPGEGTDIIINYSAGDSIVFDASDGITANSVTLVNGTGANNGSLLINLTSTGETLAILQTTSVAEFNSIGLIEVLEI
ncbi:hypothetical protein [Limnoraphis robusta]|uniref:Calcium-binding protein n=1 Tax=Limnoraphis robusta CCNP1315 TaxID=3110306 RepID=A0ABU5U728_9CYAN|nr:hypothetical protein [Limnoraphis robusta]MEA5522964.1 hypothetical protein [Limnoraphis robusta CCNP1315]MEA5545007.1 hypothetical protein [Limnoraphis robusta CCNP1324]